MKLKSGITVLGYWPLQFTAVRPYVEELLARGVPVFFCISESVRKTFPEIIERGVESISLEMLVKKKPFVRLLHALLWRLARIFRPEDSVKLFNSLSRTLLAIFLDNPFPTLRVVHVTKSPMAWALCGRNMRVFTFLGSWDHPSKFDAAGYKSDFVFAWNSDLASDWFKFQGDSIYCASYPFLFSYALNAGKKSTRTLFQIGVTLYSFTTSRAGEPKLFEEELMFARELAMVLTKKNIRIIMKPKPNELFGALDSLRILKNVEIGTYHDTNRNENLLLTPEYNERRLGELEKCDFVINIATTFAIDAALVGVPVMQVSLNAPTLLPRLTECQSSHHIQKYLLCNSELIFKITDANTIESQINKMFLDLKSIEKKVNSMSDYLRTRMSPKQSNTENIKTVVAKLLH